MCLGVVQLHAWSVGKFTPSALLPVPRGDAEWVGGAFFAGGDRLALWTKMGSIYVYDPSTGSPAPKELAKLKLKRPSLYLMLAGHG